MFDFTNLLKLRSELDEAINYNDLKRVKNFLKKDDSDSKSFINLNYIDKEGQTPLHKTCLNGNLEMCKLLVEFGASQDIRNNAGWFPIHLATYYGHMDIVTFLLNQENFKKESIISVYEDESTKYKSFSRTNINLDKLIIYRSNFDLNQDLNSSSSDEESDEESDESDDEFENKFLLENHDNEKHDHVDELINNLNENQLLNLFDFKNLELNSDDLLI